VANTKPRRAKNKRNMYSDRQRQIARKLRQNNVADGGITPKVQTVINNYFANGFVQRQAMLDAGYAESTARLDQFRIFGRPDVKAQIEARMKLLTDKSEIDGDWVMRKLKLLLDANIGEILAKLEANDYDLNCLSAEEWYVLGDIQVTRGNDAGPNGELLPWTKVKLKSEGRNPLIVTALKKLGLFVDKLEVTNQEDVTKALMAGRQRASGKKKEDE
jgi:hypothetical protein